MRSIEREFVQGAFVRVFVLGLLKIGGSEMCDVLFWEVPGCVTKCDRGRGSKLAKNSVTYFMDGPQPTQQVQVDGNVVDMVDSFTYLGSLVDRNGKSEAELIQRITIARNCMTLLDGNI